MRRVVLTLLFALSLPSGARAEDLLHLVGGGQLAGAILEEDADAVSLDLGAGTVRVPREKIRLIERNATPRALAHQITRRDEWFLVLHNGKVVGWRRLVHTEGPQRIRVEERTVFFGSESVGSGESVGDVDIRRVEVEDRQGRPVEFLRMEQFDGTMDVTSGEAGGKGAIVRVRRGGKFEVRELELPDGWRLALPAWSRFLSDAEGKERRTMRVLDPGHLRLIEVVMHRGMDRSAPVGDDQRLCHAVELIGDFRQARTFYRPGEGALAEELNGATLIAQRTSEERVALVRRTRNATVREPLADPSTILRHPMHRAEPLPAPVGHLLGGLLLTPPDAKWVATVSEGQARGRLLAFEKVALFSSLEVFVHDAPVEATPEACIAIALRRLRLVCERATPANEPEATTLAGRAARLLELRTRHREEDLRCLVAVIPARGRVITLVGACPERWWQFAQPEFRAFLKTLEIAD